MSSKTVYDHIGANNLKTMLLVAALPTALLLMMYAALWLVLHNDPQAPMVVNQLFVSFALPISGIALVWTGLSYLFGDKMILGFTGAKTLPDTPQTAPIRRAVENVALAAGLPCPKIYIIEDKGLNAFATGHSPQTASIALTSGLVDALTPLELQAVIAHEMGHIGNRDIRLNMIIITGLGVCAMLAEILFRIASTPSSSRNKDAGSAKAAIMLIGFALLLFNLIVAPLLKLAVSRSREYAADATAAYITRNPNALADALEKISKNAQVKVLAQSPNLAGACIFSPKNVKLAALELTSTHPPVSKRIERLRDMAGQM